jgi:hypothetical protein
MERSPVFSSGTGFGAGISCPVLQHRTFPFMPFLGMVEAIMPHLLAIGANRGAIGRNLNITIGFQVLRATYIKIDKRFNILVE